MVALNAKVDATEYAIQRYSFVMLTVVTTLQYVGAVLVGLIMAILTTGLVSAAVLPADGPIGEGFVIMLFYLISCCISVPSYVVLMTLHREGHRSTKRLIAFEVILRTSVIIGACFICFVTLKLPTVMLTKELACAAAVLACAWAFNPTSWGENRRYEQ